VRVVESPTVDSPAVDRTNLHRVWKAILFGTALVVAAACYFVPVLFLALGVLLVFLLCQTYMLGISGFTTTRIARLSAVRFRTCVGAGFEATRFYGKRRA
jgi:hypothetical protein